MQGVICRENLWKISSRFFLSAVNFRLPDTFNLRHFRPKIPTLPKLNYQMPCIRLAAIVVKVKLSSMQFFHYTKFLLIAWLIIYFLSFCT